MHRSFFAIKDATINSGSSPVDGTTWKDKNTGQDEILDRYQRIRAEHIKEKSHIEIF